MNLSTKVRVAVMRVFGVSLAAGFISTTPAAAEDAPEPRVIEEGRYVLSYFGKTFGEESFTIEELSDGYRITASFETRGADQVSSESVYILDASRRLVSATYHPTDGGVSATYRVDGSTVTVEASDGQTQSLTLGLGDIVTGPHYVTDFFVLHPLAYSVEQEGTITCHTFGFKDWQLTPCIVEAERVKDRTARHPDDGKVTTTVYKCRIQAGEQTFTTRSYIDEEGVSLRIKIGVTIGEATVTLKAPKEDQG